MTRWFRWFGQPGTFVLTVLLSCMALGLALGFRTPERFLCLGGMLASTMGDLINTNWRGIGKKLPFPALYGGAACFAVAHGFYIAAFVWLIRRSGAAFVNPGFWAAAAVVLASAVIISALCLRRGGVSRLTYGICLAFLFFVGGMLAAAFSFAWTAQGLHLLAAAGALSFFVSDMLIGLNVLCGFANDFVIGGVWWFYPIGQLLLLVFV